MLASDCKLQVHTLQNRPSLPRLRLLATSIVLWHLGMICKRLSVASPCRSHLSYFVEAVPLVGLVQGGGAKQTRGDALDSNSANVLRGAPAALLTFVHDLCGLVRPLLEPVSSSRRHAQNVQPKFLLTRESRKWRCFASDRVEIQPYLLISESNCTAEKR